MPTFFKADLRSRIDDKLAQQLTDAATWRAVCKVVDARDGRACRACGKKTNPDSVGLLRGHRHHIVYRSAGGPDASWNLCTLDAACHDAEHVKRTLRVEGNADDGLTFWKKDDAGEWYVWRREVAVGIFEKD